mgnify:CR=1 FL=1
MTLYKKIFLKEFVLDRTYRVQKINPIRPELNNTCQETSLEICFTIIDYIYSFH